MFASIDFFLPHLQKGLISVYKDFKIKDNAKKYGYIIT